jgi:hypothetical protein
VRQGIRDPPGRPLVMWGSRGGSLLHLGPGTNPLYTPPMTGAEPTFPSRRIVIGAYFLLFLGACAAAFYLIFPVRAGQVGFDAAASVIYFDRLVQGRHLESFVTATPKPLLTIVYGIVYNLTGDWRPISWLVIAIFGLSAVLAAILARRLGGLQAAAFAGVAVIGCQSLIMDVALSYAVVWAFAGCLLAGLAISSVRPRYAWAGVALGVAALARFEVVLILGAAAAALAAAWLWGRYRHVRGPDPRAWLVLIGFVAVPIQFAHDWLLTGDPLYAEYVPAHASLSLPLIGPVATAVFVAQHLVRIGPFVVLAAVGAIVLFRRRQWGVLLGLAAMGPGVAAFLVFLAYRRIYISGRYLDPIDLAVIVAAAIGFGAIAIPDLIVGARRITSPATRLLLLTLVAGLVSVLFAVPFAPTNRTVRLTIRTSLDVERAAQEARPALRKAIAAIPGATDWPGPSGSQPALMVPPLLRPQFVVDLGLPTTQVGGTTGTRLRTDGTYPVVGQIIFHDQLEEPDPAFDFLEVSSPTRIGSIVITPLLADPTTGIWVDRIDPAQ